MSCLDDAAIASLLEGVLTPAESMAVVAHIDACDGCRRLVADAARGISTHVRPVGPLQRGATVGRYVVLETLGAGAMGMVYAAYDPDLDRRVALKILHPDRHLSDAAGMREILLREAQAMARLSHPNVVAVYDTGAFEDELFIAMELIDDGTLVEWLAERTRGWREIALLFRQAAAGLASAHRAALVHRDFKPENVLVTGEGVAKVSDFGIARIGAEVSAIPEESPRTALATLHRTNAVLGTPAYMAPEQRAGKRADARSDMYAFGVALHEALHGTRPNGEGSARPRSVPRWLSRIVQRTLRERPEDRFADLDALMGALDAGLRRRRRSLQLGGAAVIAVLVVTLAAATGGRDPCADAAAWGDAWDQDGQAALAAAFERSGHGGDGAVAASVGRTLSRYRDEWSAMRREACRATHQRGEQSQVLLDLRVQCLERNRREVAALVRVFREADATVVDRAPDAVRSLPGLAACADADALRATAPLPADPASRARIAALEERLARGLALEQAGKLEAAHAVAVAALSEARQVGHGPLIAKLLSVRGQSERLMRRYEDAERSFHEAAQQAVASEELATAADGWTALLTMVGALRGRAAEAEVWATYADAAVERIRDPERTGRLLCARAGVLAGFVGRLDEADGLLARAAEIARSTRSAGLAGRVDLTTAVLRLEQARGEDALRIYRRLAAEGAREYGLRHASTSASRASEAETLLRLGRYPEAIAIFRDLIGLPDEETDHGWARHELAAALRGIGDIAGALVEDRRALAALAQVRGSDSVSVAPALFGVGLDLLAIGRAGEAVGLLERALAARRRSGSPIDVADTAFALGRALVMSGDDRLRARALAEEARQAYRPRAQRYGGWFRKSFGDVDAFLRERFTAGAR
jgi:serine/threonine protein kinase/tetratricopeptide (TPR) repeat protein